jgi:hypothetical protein
MLARQVFDLYRDTHDVNTSEHAEKLVNAYICKYNLEDSTTYAQYLCAVYDLQKCWWEWQT